MEANGERRGEVAGAAAGECPPETTEWVRELAGERGDAADDTASILGGRRALTGDRAGPESKDPSSTVVLLPTLVMRSASSQSRFTTRSAWAVRHLSTVSASNVSTTHTT